MSTGSESKVLGITGTRLTLDGKPFYLQGLSFFNALYNPTFNQSDSDREDWLRTFLSYGVNTLRVWCQWDFGPQRPFVDVADEHTMYTDEGAVRDEHFQRLAALLAAANRLGMVIEVVLFSQEKRPNLPVPAQSRGVRELTTLLRPHRNLILQIWNEKSDEVTRFFEIAKEADPARLVTNSPGVANVLGDDAQNEMLDLLTPHTVRGQAARFWEVAPQQIASLLERFRKPVIDDEPARNGLVQFGGIPGGTEPAQHIAQVQAVREIGGYHTYHHDMFQNGYGHPATPPSGIPEPTWPFHRDVFAYLREHRTWNHR